MNRLWIAACSVLLSASAAFGQTSYPMLMSLKPVAAPVGGSSVHVVHSQHSMQGAYQVLVSGDGVTGEIVPSEDDKKNEPKKLRVRFHIAADATPGVRDFRLGTPQGASTVGQLVVVRDPVVQEEGKNDTGDQAQKFSPPATVCGTIERNEDVDYYTFHAEAGTALNFHVRSMRLEDKIHNLQQHADPILTLRTATGATLATSDNRFFGDPFLSHRFERAGDYLLEIRDVRYEGNKYWDYSIEVNGRPFVTNVFPMGIARETETQVDLIGTLLKGEKTASVNLPADLAAGPHRLQLPLDGEASNPVPVIVSDVPTIIEQDQPNETPAQGQEITVPAGINGRIETERDVDCYTFEAKKGERFSFEVMARRYRSALDPIVRILDEDGRRLQENDDMQVFKRTYADSQIENWTAPADGRYTLEIRDLHLRGGEDFVYFVTIDRSHPYFELYLDTDKTQLTPGTSGVFFVNVVRKNGSEGEVQLAVDGLPEGVTAHCGRILAGQRDGCVILEASPDAEPAVSNLTVTGTARHEAGDGEPVELRDVAQPYQEIYRPGGGRSHFPVEMHTVAVGAPSDIRSVALSTYEVTLEPGGSQRIDVTIERAPGFEENVQLDCLMQHLNRVYGNPLPPGVSIDGAKSKTLLTGKETKGHITLKASEKVQPVSKQQVSVMANISINFVMKATYSSRPLSVTVKEGQ